MATIDLGKIKLVNRGAYNNSTAYTVDDLVQSGGSTYICIQNSTGNAVTDNSYWSVLAQGGTDVGTTLTTQGDILYRDGSGLQRLAKGTAGQALKMNTAANAPEWGSAGGLVLLKTTAITSGVASVDFNNTYVNSSYNNYKMIMRGISTSSDNQDLYVKMSVDNGSNFITMKGVRTNTQINANSQSFGGTGDLTGGIPIGSDEESDDDDQCNAEITFYDLNANNNYKFATGRATTVNQNGDLYSYVISGFGVSTSAVNFLRVYTLTGGNLDDGSISLYGFSE